ncbi:MAG: DNA primase catalytic subunit PriS [Candidatus Diapherotrites archaeon]|nr:DNA primase catalytic subunit PriS [Candidatus Diapherotrites archaeon]
MDLKNSVTKSVSAELFIKEKFRQYYSKRISFPFFVDKREFGVSFDLKKKIAMRHLAFSTENALNSFLVSEVPFFISYSLAYYEIPDARPMEAKNWLGADLAFDLDAQDIVPRKCKEDHSDAWVCEKCLGAIKDETVKLVENFLVPDFGFDKNKLQIVFSGHKGYHVHFRENEIHSLDQRARVKLIDYVTGRNIDEKGLGFFKEKDIFVSFPRPGDFGWRGKVASKVLEVIEKATTVDDLLLIDGVGEKTARMILSNKEQMIKGVNKGNWNQLPGMGGAKWLNIARSLGVKLSSEVDAQVTSDTKKLLRLPESLHGGSGFKAVTVKNLDSFDPLNEAVVFGNEPIKVHVTESPGMCIKEQTFGPFKDEWVELPEFAAVYFACRGVVDGFKL